VVVVVLTAVVVLRAVLLVMAARPAAVVVVVDLAQLQLVTVVLVAQAKPGLFPGKRIEGKLCLVVIIDARCAYE
jgi:voltage-gated potassium channel Kch